MKSRQISELERSTHQGWISEMLCVSAALIPASALAHEHQLLGQVELVMLVGLCLMASLTLRFERAMARRGIAALQGEPVRATVAISSAQPDPGIYQARLEWEGQTYHLPLANRHEVLEPLLGQHLEVQVYADPERGQPVLLETETTYLWLQAPPRTA